MASDVSAPASADAQKALFDRLQNPSPQFAPSPYSSQDSFRVSSVGSSFAVTVPSNNNQTGADVDGQLPKQVAGVQFLARQHQGHGYRRGDYFNYVPSILLRGLDARGMLPSADSIDADMLVSSTRMKQLHPFSDLVFGSILLVDISGFTRLSSKLTAEELKLRINKYFTKLLDTISYYHGDVVKFCGDALIVLWPIEVSSSDELKRTAVRVATTCALHLIADCSGVADTSNPNGALKIHCGVSCGNIHCMSLGDEDRWEFIISGRALHEVGEAESAAALGEVCLSPGAYALVDTVFDCIKYHSGVCLITEIKLCSPGCDRCARLNYRFLKIEPKVGILAQSKHSGGSDPMGSSNPNLAGNKAAASTLRSKQLNNLTPSMSNLKAYLHSTDQLNPASLTATGTPPPHPPLSTFVEQDSSELSAITTLPPLVNPSLLVKPLTAAENNILSEMINLPSTPKPDVVQKQLTPPPLTNSAGAASSQQLGERKNTKSLFAYLSSMIYPNDNKVAVEPDSSFAKDGSFFDSSYRKSKHSNSNDDGINNGTHNAEGRSSQLVSQDSGVAKSGEISPHVTPEDSVNASRNSITNAKNGYISEPSGSFDFRATPDPVMHQLEPQSTDFHVNEEDNENLLYSFLARYRHGPGSRKTVSRLVNKSTSVLISQTSSLNSLDIVEDVHNVCRVFVPHPVRVAIESDTIEFLSEIRLVSTMFVEIIGMDEDLNEGNYERPQKVVVAILRVLKKFGGGLRQFVVDDKGCVAIIGYGIPGHSHEDNNLRAIDTALTLHRRLQALKLDCKIGISSDRVYCGLVGSNYRCEFAMMGASVNLAARLMANCKTVPILVENNVYKSVGDLFHFTKLPKINAKGYKHPISVYSPHGRTNDEYFDSEEASIADSIAFVGREAVVSELLSALDIAHDYHTTSIKSADISTRTHCQSFMIESLPGLGKSKLLQHIQQKAMNRPDGPLNVLAITAPNPRAQSSMKYEVVKLYLHQLFELDPSLMTLHKIMALAGGSGDYSFERIQTARRQSTDYGGINGLTEINVGPQTRATSGSGCNSEFPDIFSSKLTGAAAAAGSELFRAGIAESQLTESYYEIERWFMNHSSPDDVFTILRVAITGPGAVKQIERTSSNKLSGYRNVVAYGTKESVMNGTAKDAFKYSCNRDLLTGAPLSTLVKEYDIIDAKAIHVLELVPLLSKVLPIYSQQCYDLYTMPSAAKLELLDSLIIFTLERAFRGAPWLLLLDRVHLCDVTSLDILHQLIVISEQNLVFLGALDVMQIAGAGDEDTDPLLELRKLCKCLELRPLNVSETKLLFEAIIDQSVIDAKPSHVNFDDCILEIHSRSEGNAFVAVTLIYRLKGSILAKTFVDIASLDFIAGEASITSFDSLSRSNQVILKLASIIGLTFKSAELSKLMGAIGVSSSGVNLATGLQELVQIGFLAVVAEEDVGYTIHENQSIVVDPSLSIDDSMTNFVSHTTRCPEDPSDRQYRFTNVTVHDNIYGLMLENQRKIAHYYMGMILEPQFSDHDDNIIRRIVYHYSHSNNLEKKLEFLARAISHSLKTKDYASVKIYLEDVIEATAGKPVDQLLRQRKPLSRRQDGDFMSNTQAQYNQRYHIHSMNYSSAINNTNTNNNYSTASNSVLHAGALKRWASARMPSVLDAQSAWLRFDDLSDALATGSSSPERVACWIAETSIIFFRLGNFRRSYNFALLACRFFGIFLCDIQNVQEVQRRGWSCIGADVPLVSDLSKMATRSVDLVLRLLTKLVMLTLLCGRSIEAKGYLKLIMIIKAFLERKITSEGINKREGAYSPSPHISKGDSFMGGDEDYLLIGSSNILYALNDIYSVLAVLASRSSPKEHKSSTFSKLLPSMLIGNNTLDSVHELSSASDSISERSFHDENGSRNSSRGSFHSCLVHITRALRSLAVGRLPESFISLDRALSFLSADTSEDDIASRQLVVLLSAWVALMGGKKEKARVLCMFVLDYARTHKQSLLLKWSLELLMMLQVLAAVRGTDVNLFLRNNIEMAMIEIKNANMRDRPSAASSALLAFSYAYERNDTLALPLARFAIDRLSQRSPITPVSGMFIFLAGYAAALLMDHQWQRLMLVYDEEQCYEEIHKSPRIMIRCDEVVREALNALASIAQNYQPILSVLHEALRHKHANALSDLRSTGGIYPIPRLFSDRFLENFDKFVFGISFLVDSQASDPSSSYRQNPTTSVNLDTFMANS